MPQATIKITGIEELQRKLRNIPEANKHAVKAGLEEIGGKIERSAQVKAPVRTGWLRYSIHATVRGYLVLIVSARAFYAYWVEHRYRAFLGPAFQEFAHQIAKLFREKILDEVKKL